MALNWKGDQLLAKTRRAQIAGVDATMGAAILEAKADHGAGAHARDRFITRTGELERSVRIVDPAKPDRRGVVGRWGSIGLRYGRRIELGYQGKDSAGRVIDQQAYPFLRPAADSQYPRLWERVRRALQKGRA